VIILRGIRFSRFEDREMQARIMLDFFITIAGLYVGWSLVCLELNHRRASSMRIPLVRVPIDPLNLFFMILESHFFQAR
jgi:hypothetical protein